MGENIKNIRTKLVQFFSNTVEFFLRYGGGTLRILNYVILDLKKKRKLKLRKDFIKKSTFNYMD